MNYNPPPSLPYISDLIDKFKLMREDAKDSEQYSDSFVIEIIIADLERLKDTLIPERYKDR